jgi:hypothetical protein
MDEDTYANFTLTGSDADGDALTFQMSVNPSHGTLSGTAPNLTHTPAADYNGADSLTFVVNDGKVNSAPATVNLNITAVNDAPVITEGTFASVTMSMNGTPIAFAMTLLATDVDTSDTIITWSISSAASHGTASASGTGSSKAINYTPNTDYVGSDSFVVQVSDGSLTDTINVNVTVSATPIPYQIYLPLVFQ